MVFLDIEYCLVGCKVKGLFKWLYLNQNGSFVKIISFCGEEIFYFQYRICRFYWIEDLVVGGFDINEQICYEVVQDDVDDQKWAKNVFGC